MSGDKNKRSIIEVRTSIAITADEIEKSMLKFSKLFDEFSMEWLLGVDSNYKEFLNYCLCSIKRHEENKKSK